MLTNRSAPPATVTPVLFYPDVREAVAWLERAFGFGERVRIGDDHRAQLRVGDDASIVVADRTWMPRSSEHAAPARGFSRSRTRGSTASARVSSRTSPVTAGS